MVGLDSSPEMIEKARGLGQPVDYAVADLRDWRPERPVDVLVSNATLQWVPGHLELLPALVAAVAPGGWFAFQVPGNFDEPSHTIRRDLAAEPPYAAHTAGVDRPDSHDPAAYYDALAAAGCAVDAWETTYLHVLRGPDPVFTWVSGTGARPTLQALPDDLRPAFEAEFKRRLAAAYPARADGTVLLPFRRVFAVAQVGVMRLHHVQVACPPGGEDDARRFYGEGLGLTEVDKPAELAGRGGAWFRAVRRRRARSPRSCTSASRSRSRRPGRRTRRSCCRRAEALEEVVARLERLGFEVDRSERDTFPGYRRVHAGDAHGNRVELLA